MDSNTEKKDVVTPQWSSGMEIRVRELELRMSKVESSQLVSENNAMHARKEVDELKKEIGVIKSGISRLLWTGGGVVILAIVNFIINGGLKIGL